MKRHEVRSVEAIHSRTGHRTNPTVLVVAVTIGVVGFVSGAARSFGAGSDASSAIIELCLPEGASITVDGRDYGENRTVRWKNLPAGSVYRSEIDILFADGKTLRRRVYVKRGWKLHLRLLAPREDAMPPAPEVVPPEAPSP